LQQTKGRRGMTKFLFDFFIKYYGNVSLRRRLLSFCTDGFKNYTVKRFHNDFFWFSL